MSEVPELARKTGQRVEIVEEPEPEYETYKGQFVAFVQRAKPADVLEFERQYGLPRRFVFELLSSQLEH